MFSHPALGRPRLGFVRVTGGSNNSATVTFNVPDGLIMQKLDENDDARRHNRPIPAVSLQFTLINRSGTGDASYMLTGCVPKRDLDAGGRKDRVRLTVRLDAQDMKKVL